MNFSSRLFLRIAASDFASSFLTTRRLLRHSSLVFLALHKNKLQRTSRGCGPLMPYIAKRLITVQGSRLAIHREARVIDSSKKEVFQPHLPVRLPCYDLAPVTSFALGRSLRSRTSGTPGFHGLTGGVYKARERIHRAMADARLLANPTSWSRVADSNPNWDGFSRSASCRQVASLCTHHCNTCVAPDVRAVLI